MIIFFYLSIIYSKYLSKLLALAILKKSIIKKYKSYVSCNALIAIELLTLFKQLDITYELFCKISVTSERESSVYCIIFSIPTPSAARDFAISMHFFFTALFSKSLRHFV